MAFASVAIVALGLMTPLRPPMRLARPALPRVQPVHASLPDNAMNGSFTVGDLLSRQFSIQSRGKVGEMFRAERRLDDMVEQGARDLDAVMDFHVKDLLRTHSNSTAELQQQLQVAEKKFLVRMNYSETMLNTIIGPARQRVEVDLDRHRAEAKRQSQHAEPARSRSDVEKDAARSIESAQLARHCQRLVRLPLLVRGLQAV